MSECANCRYSGPLVDPGRLGLFCFRYPPQIDGGQQGFPEATHVCGEYAPAGDRLSLTELLEIREEHTPPKEKP